MNLYLKIAAGVSEVVSLLCIAGLWRGRGPLAAKLLWSGVLVVPFLGPIFYSVWHDPPPPSDPIDRPPETPFDNP